MLQDCPWAVKRWLPHFPLVARASKIRREMGQVSTTPGGRPEGRRAALAVLAVLALAAAVRGPDLLSRALNYEEALCWFYARIPLRVQWERDIRGPLNYASLAPLARLSPRPEPVRLLPFVAGTASTLLPFLVRGLPLGARAVSAAFLALSPPLVRQSQDADGCSLGFLVEGLALVLAMSYALEGGRWRVVGHGLLSLLAPQVHAAFLWGLLGRAALFALLFRRSRRARALLASCLPGIAGAALSLLIFKPPPLRGGGARAAAALLLVLVEPTTGFATSLRDLAWAQALWLLAVPALLLAAIGGMGLWRRGFWGRIPVAAGLSAALLFVGAVWARGLPPLARYLLPLCLPFSLCLGAGVGVLPTRATARLLVPVFAAQAFGCAAYLARPYYGVDWREAARALERSVGPGEAVVLHPPSAGLMLRHYLGRRLDLRPRGLHWFTAKGFFVGPEGRPFEPDWRREVLRASEGRRAVWVLLWSLNPTRPRPPRRLDGLELDRLIPVRGYAESAVLARYRPTRRGGR